MPRSRSRTDEADDDCPRRRRREDEDEADDRPSRRKPVRRRRPVSPARIVAIGISLFALVVVVVIVVLVATKNSNRAVGNDLAGHVPSDAVALSGFDFNDLMQYEPYRKALERRPPADLAELDKAGLRPSVMARVLVARTASNGNACVIRFKTGPDRSQYLGADLPGKAYAPFNSLSGNYRFGYFPDPSTLVLADQEPAIQALVDRGGKGQLSGDLKSMVDQARGPAWRATGRYAGGDAGKAGAADGGFAIRAGASAGSIAWVEREGRLASVRYELRFDNMNDARAGAAAIKGLFAQQKGLLNDGGALTGPAPYDPADLADIRRGYDEAEVTDQGTKVTARVRLPAVEALRAIGPVRY
jgi:hypothetical protein